MSPEPFLEFRDALHAALGFRPDIPTATFEQLIATAKAAAKRADDAEQALAKVHEALDEALTAAGVANEGTPAERIRRLVAELDGLRESRRRSTAILKDTHNALAAAGLSEGGTFADRIRLLAEERNEYHTELADYRSWGVPPAEPPKPATRDTAALRVLLDGLEADAVRAHHPVSAASVRAVRVLVGVDPRTGRGVGGVR